MEFILALVLFFIFFGSSTKSNNKSDSKKDAHKGYSSLFGKKDDCASSHPEETFHLEDGLDHEVDSDGYCEECDDYHE